MKYKENKFYSDGITLNYITKGKGKPILFLHGGGLKALTYKKNLELLSKKYKVIAPDIPGFGNSSTPTKLWDFEDYANFFSKFIDSLNLKNIMIIGHSFGGGIAMNLATKNKRVSKLILIDSAGIAPKHSLNKIIYLLHIEMAHNIFSAKNEEISLTISSDFITRFFKNSLTVSHMFKITNNALFKKYTCFNKITQPTFIFWGYNDEVFTRDIAKKFNKRIKNSQLEYINGEHVWCLMMPEKLFELILKTEL